MYFNIAGFIICIKFQKTDWLLLRKKLFKEICKQCYAFKRDIKPRKIDYTIKIVQRNQAEIAVKKYQNKNFINLYETKEGNQIITFYQISLVQFLLILRIAIVKLLYKNSGFLLHSSASYIHGKALIFLGKDGTGKSTITQLLRKKYPALIDDISLIRKIDGYFYLFQAPFLEKNTLEKSQTKYSIGGIFFVKKADSVRLDKIKDKEFILRTILSQISLNKQNLSKQLKLIIEFTEHYNFFYIYFTQDKNRVINLFTHS